MEQTSLDDVLSDKEPEKQETDVAEAPPEKQEEVERPVSVRKRHQAKEFEAQGRDPETGQFIQKEEKEPEVKAEVKAEVKPETKKEEFTEKERAFLRGLEEERRKRQDLERQLAELRKPQEKKEEKTFWDDPEGHLKSHEQKIAARERALMLSVAERLARSKYQDFDEKIAVFEEILGTPAGPSIRAQFLAAPDPAEFAYQLGKHTKEVRDAGSIDQLKAKLEKELRQKLEAEYKVKQEELEKQRQELPGSLSDVRGSKQHQPVFKGPTPLTDIFGH